MNLITQPHIERARTTDNPHVNNHPTLRNFAVLVAVVALSLNLGCFPEKPASFRLGIIPWPGYEFLYLAQGKGFYHDEGLEVRIVEFDSLSDARRAYERGQIDALGTTVIEVLQARDTSSRAASTKAG